MMMGCVSITDPIDDWHLKTDRLERRGQKIVGWNLQNGRKMEENAAFSEKI